MNPVALITAKRDGQEIAPATIKTLIDAYTRGDVPDYQMSAFLMAAFLKGLTEQETTALCDAMLYSGEIFDLAGIPSRKVDKHSTGGVGDKISLILAPVVAACGVAVPMVSGRGLGHTGGTLDKLESIPGFRTDLSGDRFAALVRDIGVAMIGQTAELAPADRKLYALRDVTGTVEYVPFIAASIMSKKLAEGADALVFDVKCGGGAFMKTGEQARLLAETLVGMGERFGKPSVAWLTSMDVPLGRGIGNWPEVVESVGVLQGTTIPDVEELTLALAGEMLFLGNAVSDPLEGRTMAREAIQSGRAFEKFVEMVRAQDGDVTVLDRGYDRMEPAGTFHADAEVTTYGYVSHIDTLGLGLLAVELGAGRAKKEDPVDPVAGLQLNKTVGDSVEPGEVLATMYTKRTQRVDEFRQILRRLYTLSPEPPVRRHLLLGRYDREGWSEP